MLCWLILLVQLWPSASAACLNGGPGKGIKQKFTVADVPLPLKLAYSRRASHQVTGHVLKFLLEEVLGYEQVELVQQQKNHPFSCPDHSCTPTTDKIPNVMIDTEVWSPVESTLQLHHCSGKVCMVDAGPVTEYGRFGWYVPKQFVQDMWVDNKVIADHWRGLQQASVLHQLTQNLTALQAWQNMTELEFSCHGAEWCSGGLFLGASCHLKTNEYCAVLLSDFPDNLGAVIKQQLNNLALNVSVVWLGSNLERVVTGVLSGKPLLLFRWEPDILTSRPGMTRLSLPTCRPSRSFASSMNSPNGSFNCDFPYSHVRKLSWSKVHENAPEVHHVLSNLYFSRAELSQLLQLHNDAGGNMSSAELACHWLRQNRDTWFSWLPAWTFGKIPVYLGGMFPSSTTESLWSDPGILVGAEMAVEKINNDSTVLGHHELRLDSRDTGCNTARVLDAFIDFISRKANRTLVGILGPACSVQMEIVAEVSPLYNTIVMGYSVEGVGLSNRQKYPLFFRTSPSYSAYKFAYASIFEFFGWKQYATLTDTNYVSTTITEIHKHLDSRGITLVYSRLIANHDVADISIYLKSLKARNARVIIASLFDGLARAVVCEAYLQAMTPQSGYVWVLPWWLSRNWWVPAEEEVPCSREMMRTFVSGGYFSLSNAFYGDSGQEIRGSWTVSEWKKDYRDRVERQHITQSDYAAYAYDAVWAYALALHQLVTSHPGALDTIHSNATLRTFHSYLAATNFTGVSGPVEFKGGERHLTVLRLRQEFPGTRTTVGRFVPRTDGSCSYSNCVVINESAITWPGNRRPTDGTQESPEAKCSVETFRAFLDVSCSGAIAVINVICIGLFLIFVVALIWICIKRRYDRKYKETQHRMEELGLMEQSSLLQLDAWEIPRAQVVLNRMLGEGAFGTVYGGEAIISKDESSWVPVAVKTLKVGSAPEDKLEFLSEAETMKTFDHPNIVKLLGVCTKGEPSYTIMELMIHGDLKNFLLARRQFANQHCREAEDVVPTQLTRMCLDIAWGLAYLAELKLVHRDLALRNCMVGSGHVVKLGDFGMARAMFDSDYYRFSRKGMLPVRWMSPESLSDGVFTTKSDVWSLGVTFWELSTFGSFPYQGLANGEVVETVKLGRNMNPPEGCTGQLADLLKECWRRCPEDRPEPQSIVDLLVMHPAMVTACLDSPASSVPVLEEDLGPSRFRSSGRGTPSPNSTRARTLSQLTEEHFRVFRTSRSSSEVPAWIIRNSSSKLESEVAV